MPFPRMLGLGRNPNPQTGHTPNMWAHDFTAYKQAPKRTGKMKILSRNFISVSIAQKVPASISKQLPPSNRWDKQQAISASAPGAVETQWRPRRRQNLPSSVTQPRRSGTVLRERHVLPAGRQGSTAHPGLEVLLGQPGHSAAPGRENWSDCTSKSLPQSHLANRQLRGLIGKIWKQEETEEVVENLWGKPWLINRNCTNTQGKKIRTCKKVEHLRKRKWTKDRVRKCHGPCFVPASRYNTNTQCSPTSKGFSK